MVDPWWLPATDSWFPKHIMRSAWFEHAPFASWLITNLQPDVVVELGTHNGFSFYAIAETAKRLDLPTQLHAIDTWEGDDHAGYYGNQTFDYVTAVSEQYPNTHLHRATFADAVTDFPDASIDLLHIDGRHGYEDVKEDYETYLPKLSDRAVVIFHDTNHYGDGFGVHQFWGELETTAPSFHFLHGHGLGVIAPGTNPPDIILAFMQAAQANPQLVRHTYHQLGQIITKAASGKTA